MKYLVNRETKEHIVYNGINHHGSMVDVWQVVQADEEGWIKWDQSSECPLPDECRVEIKNANSKTCPFIIAAHQYYWRFIDSYRPILDKSEEMSAFDNAGAAITVKQSGDLIDRLKSAHEAAQSIPDLLAELREALGPELLRMLVDVPKPAVDPEPDMSDWRNWRAGDVVEAVQSSGGSYTKGRIYKIMEITSQISEFTNNIFTDYDDIGMVNGWQPKYFRFHSRPEKTK